MVATRGQTFKRPWRRSCLSSKLKSSSAPIGRKDSWCFHAVGSSNAPLLGSTAAEGLPRIGRTSIATRWRSCGLPQSASCSENFVIPPDVFGQTLRTYFYLLPWPNCSAYKAAQPLSPPLFFRKGMRRTRGFLDRAAYRRARLHLLMVLRSNFFSQVQRMTTANGSAFISIGNPANLDARRTSFLL